MVIQPLELGVERKPKRRQPVWPVLIVAVAFAAAGARVAGYLPRSGQILTALQSFGPSAPDIYTGGLALLIALLIWLFLFYGIVRNRTLGAAALIFLCALVPAAVLCQLGAQDNARRASERATIDAAIAAHHRGMAKLIQDFGTQTTALGLMDPYNRNRVLEVKMGTPPMVLLRPEPFGPGDVPEYRTRMAKGQALVTDYAGKFAGLDTALASAINGMQAPEDEKATLRAAMSNPEQAKRWAQFWQVQQAQLTQLNGLLDLYAKNQTKGAQFSAIQATIYDELKTTTNLFQQVSDGAEKLEGAVKEAEPK